MINKNHININSITNDQCFVYSYIALSISNLKLILNKVIGFSHYLC